MTDTCINPSPELLDALRKLEDEVILVEYPSKAAFFEMTQNPDYPGGMRAGASLDSRLYCSQEVSR